jgi:uncharacterized protein (DUF849 family)
MGMIKRPEKTILTCAITGAITDPDSTPYLPITPEEIAESALEAGAAGAAVVHLHVRNVETRRQSMRIDYYADVFERVRKGNPDLLINLTTGPGANFIPGRKILHVGEKESAFYSAQRRVEHIELLKPELCSLDFNVMHHAGESMRVNFKPVLKEMAQRIRDAGTKPELECFDSGDVRLAQDMQKEGLIEERPLWQFAMGIKYGWDHTPEAVAYARSLLPHDALWSAFGISKEEMPMVAATWLLGGHVRCGLEDNIYLSKNVLAKSNAELVLKARRIVEDLGGSLATFDEAREILDIKRKPE